MGRDPIERVLQFLHALGQDVLPPRLALARLGELRLRALAQLRLLLELRLQREPRLHLVANLVLERVHLCVAGRREAWGSGATHAERRREREGGRVGVGWGRASSSMGIGFTPRAASILKSSGC